MLDLGGGCSLVRGSGLVDLVYRRPYLDWVVRCKRIRVMHRLLLNIWSCFIRWKLDVFVLWLQVE